MTTEKINSVCGCGECHECEDITKAILKRQTSKEQAYDYDMTIGRMNEPSYEEHEE